MEYDSGSDLYRTHTRYYTPRLQRFLSEDPLGFGGGDVNLFAYVGNDPINDTDTLGLGGISDAVGISSSVIATSQITIQGNASSYRPDRSGKTTSDDCSDMSHRELELIRASNRWLERCTQI